MGTNASPRGRRRDPSGRQRARFGDLLAKRVDTSLSQNARPRWNRRTPPNAGYVRKCQRAER